MTKPAICRQSQAGARSLIDQLLNADTCTGDYAFYKGAWSNLFVTIFASSYLSRILNA